MFGILELDDMIYPRLQRGDLARCAQVNKKCHWLRKIPGPKEIMYCFMFQFRPELPIEVPKYPTREDLLRHFYKYCRSAQVDSMTLHDNDFSNYFWDIITKDAVFRVRDLRIRNRNSGFKIPATRLKRLLDHLSTSLEILRLEADIEYLEEDEDKTEFREWTVLKELELLECGGSTGAGSFWSWLWTQCGHVERLKVSQMDETATQSLTSAISTCMPNLHTIQLNYEWFRPCVEEEQIAALLSGPNRRWKIVDVNRNYNFGKAAMKILDEHFATLEELNVDGCGEITGEDLVRVLSSCPNLRSLKATHDEIYSPRDGLIRVKAKVFIDQDPTTGTLKPWSCEGSLKILGIAIIDIPRPDQPVETFSGQEREIQNLMNERIARLKNLERYSFGYNRADHGGL
ncbi:hypothetical protein BGX31_011022 [Mortierella sp. GBA43]|nr:hypothetical protein BGX31_011022 [Mortierella sp. GBA43]